MKRRSTNADDRLQTLIDAVAALERRTAEGFDRLAADIMRTLGQQCSAHNEELASHGERLEEHERRINALEAARRNGFHQTSGPVPHERSTT